MASVGFVHFALFAKSRSKSLKLGNDNVLIRRILSSFANNAIQTQDTRRVLPHFSIDEPWIRKDASKIRNKHPTDGKNRERSCVEQEVGMPRHVQDEIAVIVNEEVEVGSGDTEH